MLINKPSVVNIPPRRISRLSSLFFTLILSRFLTGSLYLVGSDEPRPPPPPIPNSPVIALVAKPDAFFLAFSLKSALVPTSELGPIMICSFALGVGQTLTSSPVAGQNFASQALSDASSSKNSFFNAASSFLYLVTAASAASTSWLSGCV